VGGFLRGAQAGGANVGGAAALEGVSWEEGGGLGIGFADWVCGLGVRIGGCGLREGTGSLRPLRCVWFPEWKTRVDACW
jgi:hypothetical protein